MAPPLTTLAHSPDLKEAQRTQKSDNVTTTTILRLNTVLGRVVNWAIAGGPAGFLRSDEARKLQLWGQTILQIIESKGEDAKDSISASTAFFERMESYGINTGALLHTVNKALSVSSESDRRNTAKIIPLNNGVRATGFYPAR